MTGAVEPHNGRLEAPFFLSDHYRGVCSCGWESAESDSATAQEALAEHYRDVGAA